MSRHGSAVTLLAMILKVGVMTEIHCTSFYTVKMLKIHVNAHL